MQDGYLSRKESFDRNPDVQANNSVDAVSRERGVIPWTTLKVGIPGYREMKASTMAMARGTRCIAADDPKVLFASTEDFAKVLSAGDRELLQVVAKEIDQSRKVLAAVSVCTRDGGAVYNDRDQDAVPSAGMLYHAGE